MLVWDEKTKKIIKSEQINPSVEKPVEKAAEEKKPVKKSRK